MKIQVRLFAAARQIAGSEEIAVEVADGATVGELRGEIVANHPGLGGILGKAALAVDSEYAPDEHVLEAGSDVAVIPPVSGG